jgi:hypothetical protein
MKTTASVSLISIVLATTVCAQRPSPTPVPRPTPTVLEAAGPEHPYSILEYRYADGAVRLEAVNKGDSDQVYHVTYTDLVNADRSSNMAKMLLPKTTFDDGARPGQSRWIGGLLPADANQRVEYKYRVTMTSQRKQEEAFDVHLDEAGRKAHPLPPQSEWSKLRTMRQAMNAGDAKPFEWVMDPVQHRPTQILRAGEGTAAEARIYGHKTPEQFSAALNELIQGGMNPAQAALKLQEEALRDFREGVEKNTMIVTRASDGTLHERPATATELEALRKKYAKYEVAVEH